METAIKAIETRYKGYKFRSRLEARWAVFYDTLGVTYEYEKEGFELGEVGKYLPDFWLPEINGGCWVEIKGMYPDEGEEAKAAALADLTEHPVFVFFGDVWLDDQLHGDSAIRHHSGWDMGYAWCRCPYCGLLGIHHGGRADRLPCKMCKECGKRKLTMEQMHILQERASVAPDSELATGWLGRDYCIEKIELAHTPCPTHGFIWGPGCPYDSGNLDRGHNGDAPQIIKAYEAARSARFEHGEKP